MPNVIKAWLADNTVTTDDKKDKIFLVETGQTYEFDDVINEMHNEETGLRIETISHVVKLFIRVVIRLLLNGNKVNVNLFYAVAKLRGVAEKGQWNPLKNSIYVLLTQGAELRKAIEETKVEILGEKSNVMYILEVEDRDTITFNGLSVHRSGNPAERATQIEILSSTTGADGTWSRKHLESNINRDGDRTLTFSTPSITARFIRLVFTPITNNKMAINEVRFTGVGSIRDELYIAEIQHKPAKWYDLRGSIDYGDTFDDKNESDKYYGPIDGFVAEQMQAAHTIIDTIYMHRGKSIELKVPDYLNNDVSSPSYQRWYSLRTGKTFATTKAAPVTDILTPKANNLYYRFSNGYVGAPITTASVNHYTMNFYMPTEEQFSDWFEESKNFDGNWYVIACDLSCYTDYTEKYDPETSPNSDFMQTFTEPTLSHRIIYGDYIRQYPKFCHGKPFLPLK